MSPAAGGTETDPPRSFTTDQTRGAILLAGRSDGLPDLVHQKNQASVTGRTWYGRFGAKLTMASTPPFDRPENNFRAAPIRLRDIGSGTTDILYVHRERHPALCPSGWQRAHAVILPSMAALGISRAATMPPRSR
jgi:hypothetical protein